MLRQLACQPCLVLPLAGPLSGKRLPSSRKRIPWNIDQVTMTIKSGLLSLCLDSLLCEPVIKPAHDQAAETQVDKAIEKHQHTPQW